MLLENMNEGTGINAILYSASIADLVGFIIAMTMPFVFFRKINTKDEVTLKASIKETVTGTNNN